ncbi:MAG: Crp/Fnr family transcriptional regulator [Anaerolineae bacterium]|nr:Crp/Fnr family transcriptional regulator [Anaerolineae bacterium]
MNERFLISHLRRLPIFAHVAPDQYPLLAGIAQVTRVEPGTLLVTQGQPSQAMYLFISGRGILTRRGDDGLDEQAGTVGEGQFIGEETLYSERIEPYSLRIVETSIVVAIPKRALASLITHYPELRANIGMQQVATRKAVQIFKGQREDETVRHIFKRHWWAFGRKAWFPMLIATALIVGAGLSLHTPAIALILLGSAVIVPGGILLILYADWQNDMLIITDQRIVKIEDALLRFEKTINEMPLERAYEVIADIPPDPFARLFGYGRILVKTGGSAGEITIDTMPDPKQIQRIIFAERDSFRSGMTSRSRELINRELDQAFGVARAETNVPAAQPVVEPRGFNPLRTHWVASNGDNLYRRHLSVWGRHILAPLIIMVIGIGFGLASLLVPTLQSSAAVGLAVGAGLFLFGCLWFYLADWDWRHDLLIVSQDTITIIHKRPLWLQNETEQVRLYQVDNVVSEVNGVIDHLLNRGNIRISLVGSDLKDAKRFNTIGDPQKIQGEISRRLALLHEAQASSGISSQAIADYLAAYHQRITGEPASPAANAPYSASTYTPPPADVPPPQVRDGSRPPNIPRTRGDDPS